MFLGGDFHALAVADPSLGILRPIKFGDMNQTMGVLWEMV
jgi:hypothetical protein